MPNPYELAGREKKVDALLKALDWVAGHPVSAAGVLAMSTESLDYAVQVSAVKTPSGATIESLAERIRERDQENAE